MVGLAQDFTAVLELPDIVQRAIQVDTAARTPLRRGEPPGIQGGRAGRYCLMLYLL